MEATDQFDPQQFQAELKQIREDYARAKRILKSINEYYSEFEEVKQKLADGDSGLIANFEKVKAKSSEIERFQEQSQGFLGEISTNLQRIKGNISEMETAFSQFTEIKGKITSKDGEIQTLLSNAHGLKEDIERTKKEAQQTLENIKTAFGDIQVKIQEIQKVYEKFLETKGRIEDKESGLEAIYSFVHDLQKKSKSIFEDTKSFRDESIKLLENIKKNKIETDNLKTKVTNNLNFTQDKKKEIEAATGLIIDTSFAETFEKRRREIEKVIPTWIKVFCGSLIVLGLAVIFLQTPYSGIGVNGTYEYILKRLVLTSPLLVLIFFSGLQYARERDLAEKYAFKAASSAAIRSHIDYLTTNFPNQPDVVLEFARNTFSTIYKEPYESNEQMKQDIKRLTAELQTARGNPMSPIDIKSMLESVKELKKLVSSDTLLEKIISIFVKK